MATKIRSLHVLMNGAVVGKLLRHSTGVLSFEYDDSWLENKYSRPISLSLPLSQKNHSGDLVYHFFDNLLPDNPRIRARIQARFNTSSDQPFDLLANIGRDCVGAIQLCEDLESIADVKNMQYQALSEHEIANLLQNYREAPLGMATEAEDFRISMAGAQEKSALLLDQGRWCRPLGSTPTSHIFKLPIGMIEHQGLDLTDSCENEWLCIQIAKYFGFTVPDTKIMQFEGVKTLVVERFDRQLAADKTWLMRIPQEDMCQALGLSPNLKYQADGGPGIIQIMRLLLSSELPIIDRETFFRAQILFWLLAAIDGHAKNFSIFLETGGRYRLTPLYDIMSAHPLIANKQLQAQKIKMSMALKGKNQHYHWYNAQRRHFASTAIACDFSSISSEQLLDDMLQQIDQVISQVAALLPANFPESIAQPIFDGMKNMRNKLAINKSNKSNY